MNGPPTMVTAVIDHKTLALLHIFLNLPLMPTSKIKHIIPACAYMLYERTSCDLKGELVYVCVLECL